VNKLVVLSGGFVAAGSAALIGAGIAISQPDATSTNVVGEQYNKALQILKSQGIKATFGGSHGSVLPQAECLVDSQKAIETTDFGRPALKLVLMLDCTQKAADLIAEQKPDGAPTVGSNGVTTVTPTPVVPIQGAPGPVAPPPA
jgi:hypothetical protein